MANTPEGTPYVESSDLVANYPAASLALANRVDLVGVLPFANAAARTTAIPTPTDGQYSYLQDTNATEFWNGAAWVPAGVTPGLRIVAPTSIANSGGSASASGGQVTFTGVSSVSLNGVFTSAYQNYRIIISLTHSISTPCFLRLRASGSDLSGSNYVLRGIYWASSVSVQSGTVTAVNLTPSDTLATDVSFDIFNPNASSVKRLYLFNAGSANVDAIVHSWLYNAATSADGLTIYPNTGNITGTIRVYGYQNS